MEKVVEKRKNMMEEKIIAHCAPTLAGMKTANLFSCRYKSDDILQEDFLSVNQKLNEKGVFVEILKRSAALVLVYVYRREKLEMDLQQCGVKELLKGCGYSSCKVEDCIEKLKGRIDGSQSFPHEIGVFLSYPLHDVIGFIEQKGKNCKYCGLWKVYHNECETIKLFAKFKKCTEIYMQIFEKGWTITQLTVAA